MSYLPISDVLHPSQRSDLYEKLMLYCDQNSILFVDSKFPPEKKSLVSNSSNTDYQGQFDAIAWKRSTELFGEGQFKMYQGISPCDIRQGALGNCYFLCSLSSLAEQPDLIKRLFVSQDVNEYGAYAVWLNVNGAWKMFILDDYFPSSNDNGPFELAFSKTDHKELWVILLEKAYAKAYGSYWDIIGGDPVHALRDLTGAPYDRIENLKDQDTAWERLKSYNVQNFIITCFTKSTKRTEEKIEIGIVSGHAYSILDLREIVDSQGQLRRIVQLRNPWGSFEWKGDFSDNSPLWTPTARQDLNVQISDDGIFWMPFSQMPEFFEGIGILKTQPGYVGNSVYVQRSKFVDLHVVRLTVRSKTNISLSIDQTDTRLIDKEDYSYSYFRITVGRIQGKETIEFVDSLTSSERNIFLENELAPGDYIILIEPYWANSFAKSFNVGSYSESYVELEILNAERALYRKAEYLIWKNYITVHKDKLQFSSTRVAKDGTNKVKIDCYKVQDDKYANIIHGFYNQSTNIAVHTTYNYAKLVGFMPVARTYSLNVTELITNMQDNDVIVFNMDPRSEQFSMAYKATAEELLLENVPNDSTAVSMLNSLGGIQPTVIKKETANVTSRIQKAQEIEENDRKNKDIEQIRKKQQELASKKVEAAKKKREAEEEKAHKLAQRPRPNNVKGQNNIKPKSPIAVQSTPFQMQGTIQRSLTPTNSRPQIKTEASPIRSSTPQINAQGNPLVFANAWSKQANNSEEANGYYFYDSAKPIRPAKKDNCFIF